MKKIIIASILNALFFTGFSQCYESWSYKKDVWIKNTSGTHFVEQQLPLNLKHPELIAEGKLNADASDLRITDDSCNNISFYFKNLTTDTIWVKIPELSNGDSLRLNVYYGNPSETISKSSGDSTFIFYDDFEDGVIDTSKWEIQGTYNYISEENGVLTYCSNNRWKQVNTVMLFDTAEVTFDFTIRMNNNGIYGFSDAENMLERYVIRNYSGNMAIVSMNDTISENGFYVTATYPGIKATTNIYSDLSFTMSLQDSLLTFHKVENHTAGEDTTGDYTLFNYKAGKYNFLLTTYTDVSVSLDYIMVRRPFANAETIIGNEATCATITEEVCKSYTCPSGRHTWSSSGIYTDTIPNSTMGDSIITIILTVKHVDTALTVDNNVLTADATSAAYQWIDCNGNTIIAGETNQSYEPNTNGSYAVIITQNGCIDTSGCHAIIVTDIIDNSFGKHLKVFPNPTSGKLTIELGKKYDNVSIKISSPAGEVISNINYREADMVNFEIERGSGIYFINILTNDGKSAVLKIIKPD